MITQAVLRFQAGNKDVFVQIAEYLKGDVKAKSRAHASFIPGYDPEDIEQELLLILEEAALKFKPSYGVQFRTFFWRLADKRISYLQRQEGFDKRRGHHEAWYYHGLTTQTEATAEEIEGPLDCLCSVEEEGYTESELLYDILSHTEVTDTERQIVRLKLEGYSNKEVSELIGRWATDRGCYVDRALARLKKKLAHVLAA